MKRLYLLIVSIFAGYYCSSTMHAQGWSDPELVYESISNGDAKYPAIAVDNVRFEQEGTGHALVPFYGRPHIAWTALESSNWRTFYKVYDYRDQYEWSNTTHVDKERKTQQGQYQYYYSDIPTRPDIYADPEDDRADIVFCHERSDWYYPTPIPENAVPVREVLFLWKADVAWGVDYIDPPDHLHHVSGLQKGIESPVIDYMGFYPIGRYMDAVAWSQPDKSSSSNNTIYFNCQTGQKFKARSDIDWVEQARASGASVSTGQEPFMAIGFNKTITNVKSEECYMMAVVSSNSSGIQCAFSNIQPNDGTNHEWTVKQISGSDLTLPSCAFDYPSDPSSNPPELHVVYREQIDSLTYKYYHRTLEDVWDLGDAYWSSAELIATLTLRQSDPVPYGGPVIGFGEDNARYIAYIGPDLQVYVQKKTSGGGPATARLTTPRNYIDGEDHLWVRMAIDDVYLENGLCPQVVFDGEDSAGDRNIYWCRYFE